MTTCEPPAQHPGGASPRLARRAPRAPPRLDFAARRRAAPSDAGGCTLEARGLGRSPACDAFDGPARPLAEQLELLSAAQTAVEMHFSFPGESTAFIHHAAPVILRLVAAMGYAPTNATVKAVHAALLRVVNPERVGDTDQAVYQAMGVPARTFGRWKKRLDELRAAAAPAGEAPGDDALGAAGVLSLRRLLLSSRSMELLEAREPVLSPQECDKLLQAIASAPEDVDHRHSPLETLAGGAFEGVARGLVDRLRAGGAAYAELRLQRAFCITYHGQGDGHAAHEDPCAFTINVALSPATAYEGGELEIHADTIGTYRVAHQRGCALLHSGALRHSAAPLTRGERSNLIIWCDRAPHFSMWAALLPSPQLLAHVLSHLDLASLCRLGGCSHACAEAAGGSPQWLAVRRALAPPCRLLGEAWGCVGSPPLAAPQPRDEHSEARSEACAGEGGLLLRALTALAAAVDAHERAARPQAPRRASTPDDAELAQARRHAARSRVASRVASAMRALQPDPEGRARRAIVLDERRVRLVPLVSGPRV